MEKHEKHTEDNRTMYYGKDDVWVYRTYAKPLTKVKPILESAYLGDNNVIFAMKVKVEVRGQAFLPSFTEGDNTLVVATDSMKNFILREAANFNGDTVEGFLHFIANKFLNKYEQMTSIKMSADRIPFENIQVAGEQGFVDSEMVYRRSYNDFASFMVEVERTNAGNVIVSHQCSVSDLQLIKVKGSAFAGFVRDEYTSLPETTDRPLFIGLNIGWQYENPEEGIDATEGRYVPSEHIRDIAQHVFHQIASPSIQNLIYHIGQRVLERFPQIGQVSFESNNKTWETIVDKTGDSEAAVYTEPRPPFGFQGFTMTQADLPHE
ncbi:MAG: urate oxidase [Gorillibacterium sp.]|nr:urate oxidase [Gorillibacterium sp.]